MSGYIAYQLIFFREGLLQLCLFFLLEGQLPNKILDFKGYGGVVALGYSKSFGHKQLLILQLPNNPLLLHAHLLPLLPLPLQLPLHLLQLPIQLIDLTQILLVVLLLLLQLPVHIILDQTHQLLQFNHFLV